MKTTATTGRDAPIFLNEYQLRAWVTWRTPDAIAAIDSRDALRAAILYGHGRVKAANAPGGARGESALEALQTGRLTAWGRCDGSDAKPMPREVWATRELGATATRFQSDWRDVRVSFEEAAQAFPAADQAAHQDDYRRTTPARTPEAMRLETPEPWPRESTAFVGISEAVFWLATGRRTREDDYLARFGVLPVETFLEREWAKSPSEQDANRIGEAERVLAAEAQLDAGVAHAALFIMAAAGRKEMLLRGRRLTNILSDAAGRLEDIPHTYFSEPQHIEIGLAGDAILGLSHSADAARLFGGRAREIDSWRDVVIELPDIQRLWGQYWPGLPQARPRLDARAINAWIERQSDAQTASQKLLLNRIKKAHSNAVVPEKAFNAALRSLDGRATKRGRPPRKKKMEK